MFIELTSWNFPQDFEVRFLRIRDFAVDQPADENVQEDDERNSESGQEEKSFLPAWESL